MTNKVQLMSLSIALLTIICCKTSFSQTDSQHEIIEADKTRSCEFVSAIYGSFAQNTVDKTIIIISYKGEKETKAGITSRRLHNAKTYLTEFYKGTPYFHSPDKVITATGTGKTSQGKLDFYIEGKLSLTLFFLNNRDFDLSPCYIEYEDPCKDTIKKLFYPCIEYNNKKAKSS